MLAKALAGLLAAAVLSVGGYTYLQYADCGHCCGTPSPTSQPSATNASDAATPSCCQEPSRAGCLGVSTGLGCCDDATTGAAPEVLTIPPREVQ